MSTTTTEAKGLKETDRLKQIDFKMISFTLAGKDYGIDILKVKEIRKAGNFTKVPNTPIFVRGVDNLRGDIIPVIDLRVMFNLPAESKDAASLENIVILRLESLVLGVVVDSIEKVVGISSESIQPPHPILATSTSSTSTASSRTRAGCISSSTSIESSARPKLRRPPQSAPQSLLRPR
jgi:purine-binding chemotaxis protein CheW